MPMLQADKQSSMGLASVELSKLISIRDDQKLAAGM
jgi:hypothetical protein